MEIKKRFEEENEGRDRYRSVTACLTQIRGGTAHNVMPGRCIITIDMRIPPKTTCSQVLDKVREVVSRFESDISFPKFRMDVFETTEPFEAEKSSPLMRAIIRSIIRVRGKRPLLLHKTGTGDMNILGHTLKIPVITYGPGNPHLSHTRREGVEITDYLASIEILQQTVQELSAWERA